MSPQHPAQPVRTTLEVRRATPADAQRIWSIHADAIRVLCAADYTPGQVDAWLRFRSVDDYRRALSSGETNWVATHHGEPIGYATYVAGELTALFVDPTHARRGAGATLLATVERHAIQQHVHSLTLQSTVTSRRFYERHGYVAAGDEPYTLPDGVTLPCVRMSKTLRSHAAYDPPTMLVEDLGTLSYRDAWAIQEDRHARVLAGEPNRLLLVEHPPVITFGRRGATPHLLASQAQLADMGVELVESDRGGDVTFHGPGQIVAYPIVRLQDHALSVSAYVHTLERILIDTLADFGIRAHTDPTAVGVWVDDHIAGQSAKIAAIGVRIRRGVSLHGLALNVSTDLRYFNLIVPCGLAGRPVTSLARLLGDGAPPVQRVRSALSSRLVSRFSANSLHPDRAGV